MEPSEIQELMSALQSPSLDMDNDSLNNVLRACAVVEDMCTDRCREVIKIAHKGPVLQMYMSDGWSCDMRNRDVSNHGGLVTQCRGRMRTEFLLQRALSNAREAATGT